MKRKHIRHCSLIDIECCHFHLQYNAGAYVPKEEMRKPVSREIDRILTAPDDKEARRLLGQAAAKYRRSASCLTRWMETALPEGFAVFTLPIDHRRRMRTTNMLERVNREVKRRTRAAMVFPNATSLLRLVSAVLMEISEEWETGKIDLNLKEKSAP